MRPGWDATWLTVADALAARSKCVNRQVGAVIVNADNRPVSVGYNGAPAGFPMNETCVGTCARANGERGSSYGNCVSVHAEANALIFADRRHYEGGTIYVTNPPCFDCAKLISNSGITRVVACISDADSHADVFTPKAFLELTGVSVELVGDAHAGI